MAIRITSLNTTDQSHKPPLDAQQAQNITIVQQTPPPLPHVKVNIKGRVSSRPQQDSTIAKVYQAAKKSALFTFLGGAIGYVFGASIISFIVSSFALQNIYIFPELFTTIFIGGLISFLTQVIAKFKKISTPEKIAAFVSSAVVIAGLCLYAAMMASLAAEIVLPPLWPFLIGTLVGFPIIYYTALAMGTVAGCIANKYLQPKK